MEAERFDAMAKVLSAGPARRRVLGRLLAGALAGLLSWETVDADRHKKRRQAASKKPHTKLGKEGGVAALPSITACTKFCAAVFPAGPARARCTALGARGRGLCVACVPELNPVLVCGTPDPMGLCCHDSETCCPRAGETGQCCGDGEHCCPSTGECVYCDPISSSFNPETCHCDCLPGFESCTRADHGATLCLEPCPPGMRHNSEDICPCECEPGLSVCRNREVVVSCHEPCPPGMDRYYPSGCTCVPRCTERMACKNPMRCPEFGGDKEPCGLRADCSCRTQADGSGCLCAAAVPRAPSPCGPASTCTGPADPCCPPLPTCGPGDSCPDGMTCILGCSFGGIVNICVTPCPA